MARKRILSTLDTSIAYEAVGLDLAKTDVALAAFDSDHKEPYFIDRIPYDKLYELLANMAPTLVAMEPCSGAHQIAEQIQALGHEVMMISGRHVQAWVKDHCNGQKTDLNDAFAILNLAYDRWLTPIRGKTREECRLLALQASYRQLKGQRTKTMVHVKATLHAWGFPIRTGSFNQKALRELIDANREAFGGEMAETLHLMIDRVRGLDHDICYGAETPDRGYKARSASFPAPFHTGLRSADDKPMVRCNGRHRKIRFPETDHGVHWSCSEQQNYWASHGDLFRS